MTLKSLDFWRLADELSVVDAAILITGNDPEEKFEAYDADGNVLRGPNGERMMYQRIDHPGFDAAFKGLKGAIRSNKLRATIRHRMRTAEYEVDPDYGPYVINSGPEYIALTYDFLIARHGTERSANGRTALNVSANDFHPTQDFLIWKEPDWSNTTIDIEDLKDWLSKRGVYPPFFFPSSHQEGFRNKSNPRYAPKLAVCSAAWEAVTAQGKNMSVKQTLKDWIRSNGAPFGIGDAGIVTDAAADELAKIVNWQPNGGATPTAGNSEAGRPLPPPPVENYPYGYPTKESAEKGYRNSGYEDDDLIPF